jgi:hypothetical protein
VNGPPPEVSVVVVTYNGRGHVERCLEALRRHAGLPHELIVVDNASPDGTADLVASLRPEARLLRNTENRGFGAACNQGLCAARAARVLLVNPDAELQAGALPALTGALDADPRLALVGPRTLDADGTAQLSFGPPLTLWHELRRRRFDRALRARRPWAVAEAEREVSRAHEPLWLSASCVLARAEALSAVGGFDERYFLYEEDVDLCLRLRAAGFRLRHVPEATVVHLGGRAVQSASALARREYDRSHVRFYARHNGTAQLLGLRLWLAASALLRLLLGRGPGATPDERRALQRQLLGIALRER